MENEKKLLHKLVDDMYSQCVQEYERLQSGTIRLAAREKALKQREDSVNQVVADHHKVVSELRATNKRLQEDCEKVSRERNQIKLLHKLMSDAHDKLEAKYEALLEAAKAAREENKSGVHSEAAAGVQG